MKTTRIFLALVAALLALDAAAATPDFLVNVYGREHVLLNGEWNYLIDSYDVGTSRGYYNNTKPKGKNDFYEFSFDGAPVLNVPGDWNSQCDELKYYEGTLWYGRHFEVSGTGDGNRRFLYFGAVTYKCSVYLNGKLIASHEGGFTPFQAEVTDILKEGDNFIAVRVNNRRSADGIPAMNFDWWNYGGITRDVMIVTTPQKYISDYFIALDKNSPDLINASVKVEGGVEGTSVRLVIPELKVSKEMKLGEDGASSISFKVKHLQRWAPGAPKLYKVCLAYGNDSISEEIGFRNISVDGTKILINGEPVFLRGVNMHEEVPQRKGRAVSEEDAGAMLSEAEALGVNLIRLAHYPQNEYTVRLAEKKGILLWEEIPVWQGIDFGDGKTLDKALNMLAEMIRRDRNRCAIGFWSIANETTQNPERNAFLERELAFGRSMDDTRLYSAAFFNVKFDKTSGTFTSDDPVMEDVDVVGVNEYLGWYVRWPGKPEDLKWNVAPDKPLLYTEFGGEALYGKHGDADVASSWSEDYQEALYEDNVKMFGNIPNLCGTLPWVLYDFRSPIRNLPGLQDGWNRKGLVSDQGQRKKAWYVMKRYYDSIKADL